MAISTNQKPTIYRNLYENTAPDVVYNDLSVKNCLSPLILSVRGPSLDSRIWHLYRRQILTSKDGPRTEIIAQNYNGRRQSLDPIT